MRACMDEATAVCTGLETMEMRVAGPVECPAVAVEGGGCGPCHASRERDGCPGSSESRYCW